MKAGEGRRGETDTSRGDIQDTHLGGKVEKEERDSKQGGQTRDLAAESFSAVSGY